MTTQTLHINVWGEEWEWRLTVGMGMSFCSSNDNIKEMIRQATKWKKVFTNFLTKDL